MQRDDGRQRQGRPRAHATAGPDAARRRGRSAFRRRRSHRHRSSKDLPAGDGKELVAEKCEVCHDLRRVVVKRSNRDHWAHTVARMRTRMAVAIDARSHASGNDQDRRLSGQRTSPRSSPTTPTAGCRARCMTGKAVHYRVVTYDLVNTHAEPHDVAIDPQGQCLGLRARRQARPLRSARRSNSPSSTRRPARPRKDRQSLGNPQIDSNGILWVADGPNNRWLSYDTNERQVPRLRVAGRQGRGRRQQHGAASRRHRLGDRRRQGSAPAVPGNGRVQVLRGADRQAPSRFPAPTASRSPATARSGSPKTKST